MYKVNELKEAGCELLGNDGNLDWYYKKMETTTTLIGVNPKSQMAEAGCTIQLSNAVFQLMALQTEINGFKFSEWIEQLEHKEAWGEKMEKLLKEALERIKKIGDVDFLNAFEKKYNMNAILFGDEEE